METQAADTRTSDEFIFDAFADDPEVSLENLAQTTFGVSFEALGVTKERRDNIFRYSSKIRKRVNHFEATGQTLDLGFLVHEVEWFLNAEYDIYCAENDIKQSRSETRTVNDDGTYTIIPEHNVRRGLLTRKFIEARGICEEKLEEIEPKLLTKPGRVQFLADLRQDFEHSFYYLVLGGTERGEGDTEFFELTADEIKVRMGQSAFDQINSRDNDPEKAFKQTQAVEDKITANARRKINESNKKEDK